MADDNDDGCPDLARFIGKRPDAALRILLRGLIMNAHSLSNRADARSFVVVQDVRGPGPAMRPPLAARPEGRSADPPQECASIIAPKFAFGDSNTEPADRPPVTRIRAP